MDSKQRDLVEDVEEGEEEEYVLLDLEDVSSEVRISAGASYVLSGLDTVNPVLTFGNNVKLIGEYQETVGTCLVFSETDDEVPPTVLYPETGSSDMNLIKETCIIGEKEAPSKQIKPMASLHKILKFRLASEDEV